MCRNTKLTSLPDFVVAFRWRANYTNLIDKLIGKGACSLFSIFAAQPSRLPQQLLVTAPGKVVVNGCRQ